MSNILPLFPARAVEIELSDYIEELRVVDSDRELVVLEQPSTGNRFAVDRRKLAAGLAKVGV